MKYEKSLLFLIIVFSLSCSSYKTELHKSGQKNEIIENAIVDFLSASSHRNKSNAFRIEFQDFNENLSTVAIDAIVDVKVFPRKVDTIGNKSKWFPSRYYEWKNKLFIEVDSSRALSQKMIAKMWEYEILDSTEIKTGVAPLLKINESDKQTHYFFCKSKITQYESLKSTAVIGEDIRIKEFKCSQ